MAKHSYESESEDSESDYDSESSFSESSDSEGAKKKKAVKKAVKTTTKKAVKTTTKKKAGGSGGPARKRAKKVTFKVESESREADESESSERVGRELTDFEKFLERKARMTEAERFAERGEEAYLKRMGLNVIRPYEGDPSVIRDKTFRALAATNVACDAAAA